MSLLPAWDWWSLVYQILYYLPWYIALVVVPMVIYTIGLRLAGISSEAFETVSRAHVSYEQAFRSIVLIVLYYPLFEELVFRGFPYMLFGFPGILVGSTVWVTMHPAWQLQYLSDYPLSKKIAFTILSALYYSSSAAFYSIIWLAGHGFTAILYHMLHNGWLTLADLIKEVELPTPWKKTRFIQPARSPRRGTRPQTQLPKQSKKTERPEASREPGEEPITFTFVKAKRRLSEEEEPLEYMFVKRKS